jgi:transcriptional regulator GlxA family with amidase domain
MSKKPRFPPKPAPTLKRPRRPQSPIVLFVLFPDFQILDAAGPLAAFEMAGHFAKVSYDVRFASLLGGMIASSAGAPLPTQALKGMRFEKLDTLLVVGGQGASEAFRDANLIAAIKRAHKVSRRTASVCSGSFLLAAAGLLENKRATTHWRRAPLLQRLFPNTKVEPDCIWTQDGKIWTSAGVTAGIDLALALIASDHGADVAKEVAREMVVYAQRPGGQTQHSSLLALDHRSGRFSELNAWMRDHLGSDLSVERLAAQAAMSPRNFARAYGLETGATPAKAVERMRLEAARAELETGRAIQDIARRTGFGDVERMRRAFIRVFGAPPATLRRTLRQA